MKTYLEKLVAYLESKEKPEGEDLVEGIYQSCFAFAALDAEPMKGTYQDIYRKTRQLPIREEEEFLDALNDGFATVERIAFCEGFRLGAGVVLEGMKG